MRPSCSLVLVSGSALQLFLTQLFLCLVENLGVDFGLSASLCLVWIFIITSCRHCWPTNGCYKQTEVCQPVDHPVPKRISYFYRSSSGLCYKGVSLAVFQPCGINRQLLHSVLHSVVPENIHTPPTEGIGNSWRVGGSQRPKNLSTWMKLDWNFQRGGGWGVAFTLYVHFFVIKSHYKNDIKSVESYTKEICSFDGNTKKFFS